jgi:hypothetical protein
MDSRLVSVEGEYYEQFDADLSREVPAEGFGGWKKRRFDVPVGHTGVVVMHAWDCGTAAEYPGWHRTVEYFPRAERIVREVFPRLLAGVRGAGMQVFHVVGPGEYFQKLPGYRRAVELAGPGPAALEMVEMDAATAAMQEFRRDCVVPGKHNMADIERGVGVLDFPGPARPVGDEGVAENGHQLAALCRHHGICHLVYVGFAINWCLLLSPGGMAEMRRYGVMCSTIREAVTAVENKESARGEFCKQMALWRVCLQFGLVFGLEEFLGAIGTKCETRNMKHETRNTKHET